MVDKIKDVQPPRGLARLGWRAPIWLYRLGLGGLLGGRFVLLTHIGRKSGLPRQAVLEVVNHNKETGAYVVASGFGEKSDWYRNVMANPEVTIQVGRERKSARAERLPISQAVEVMLDYNRRHPTALRNLANIIGYQTDGSEADVRFFFCRCNSDGCIDTISQPMKTQNQENRSLPSGTMLYRFNEVPVVAQPGFWPAPVVLTGLLAWIAGRRNPERSRLQRLGVGLLAMLVALFADIGHAMAHTISARLAGAPMDEILLSSGMPRTLYRNSAVQPQTHIRRSLGGPIFSLIGFTISLLWRLMSPKGSLNRDLADASLAGHSFILLGSVAPLPMVDGGTILKWKLVEAGRSSSQADQMVHKISLGLGASLLGLGALPGIFRKRKLVGGLLTAGGAVGIAAGIGWLK